MAKNIAIIEEPEYIEKTLALLKEERGKFKVICMYDGIYEAVCNRADCVLHKQYLPKFDVEEKAIKWLKNISKPIWRGNVTVKELFAYDGASMWWFMCPWIYTSYAYYHSVKDITQSIELIRSILNKEKPKKVLMVGNEVLTLKVLRKLCKKRKIKLVHQQAPSLSALKYHIGWKLKPACIHMAKQGRMFMRYFLWQVLRVFYGEKHHPPSKRTIFLLAGTTWQSVFDIQKKKSVMGEHAYHNIIKELKKDKHNAIYVVDYATRYDTKFRKLVDTIKYKHVAYRPFERYVSIGGMFKALKIKNQFNTLWKQVRDEPAVKKTFVYHGVDVYDLIRPQLDYFFSTYCKEKLEHIEIAKNLIKHENPDVIVLDSSFSLFTFAVVVAAKQAGVPTIGMQSGAWRESDPILVYYPEEVDNRSAEQIMLDKQKMLEDKVDSYGQNPIVVEVKAKIKRLKFVPKKERYRMIRSLISGIEYELLNAECMHERDVRALDKMQDELIRETYKFR